MKNNFKNQWINYFFKVSVGRKMIQKCATKKWRRFLNNSRLIHWQNPATKVYLRIVYGKERDNFGHLVKFYNDGDYTTKAEFNQALAAFLE